MLDFEGIKIKWLGHAGFKIKNAAVIYIDPYQIEDTEPADLILISHEHHDHCSQADVAKISKEGTIIVGPREVDKKIVGNTKVIKPGQTIKLKGVLVSAVHAYNIERKFHPKEKEGVGFIITIDGKKIYHAGDTDLIPEMEVVSADIALLPVSGAPYVMGFHDAAKATKKIKPKIAIPMHYGTVVGTKEDAKRFSELCECEVRILEKE